MLQPRYQSKLLYHQHYQAAYQKLNFSLQQHNEFSPSIDSERTLSIATAYQKSYLLILDIFSRELLKSGTFAKIGTAGLRINLPVTCDKHNFFHKSSIGPEGS